MELDGSDILGQDTMPIAQNANFHIGRDSNLPRSLFSFKKLILVLVSLALGYVVGIRLWRRFLVWRERSYKLATRRRHGIPDDDLRPFNVAYTDAVMRAREEDLRKQAKSRPPVQDLPVQVASVSQVEAVPANNLRQRPVPDTALHGTAVALPGGYNSRSTESMLPPAPRSNGDRLPNGCPSVTHVQVSSVNRRPDRPSIYAERHDGHSDTEVKKRSRHMEQDEEHEAKKTRVEGEELIDGDEDAEFEEGAPRRGSKRGIQEEPDDDSEGATETKQSRGKRARKVSNEKAPQSYQAEQNMDIDDEDMDDIAELKPISRGRKRDRAEAGSTFGGDDDESALENEVDGDSKLRRRRRKRRTVAKRKSEATYLRGKKREREGEEDADDDASDETSYRRKRGKNVQRHEMERQKSDVSMDESVTSSKRVREIGEEWESNGVRYKIGPNGQRLRQALVKRARQKFVMPKDSQHPDRDANMQVCIECWLTEEEYQQAKAEHLLAWQDSPKRSDDAEKLSLDISSQGVPFPPSIPGKNLLWSASASTTPTMSPASHSPSEAQYEIPLPRRASSYRHSIATSVGLPMAPFDSSTATFTTAKRISSTSRALSLTGSINPHFASSVNGTDSPGMSSLSDSTNGSPRTPAPAKVFSKWEKQELEARAIMKVREANRKKEMEKEAREREVREARERAERERAAAAERTRLEKERHEKERQERERLEREKAEREKKEKEAAAAASTAPGGVPTITVTAPSIGAASTSNNFFSQTSSTKPPETSASTGVPNFFAKPTEPVKPATTGFGFGVSPATSSDVPSVTATSTAPAAPASNQLPFSFTNSSGAASEQKKDVFGIATPGPTGTSQSSGLAQPQSNSIFPFTKSEASASAGATAQPISVFPTPAATTSDTTSGSASAGTTGATTTPKFSFNFNKSAATTTPMTTPVEKKETPIFSFKPSTTTTGTTGTDTSSASGSNGVSAPKFAFGPTFGTTSSGASTTAAAKDTTIKTGFGMNGGTTTAASPFGVNANVGSVFGLGTSSGTNTSSFGANPSSTTPKFGTTGGFGTTPSTFGKPSGPSAFGSTASPFGTATPASLKGDISSPLNPFSSATSSNTNKTESKPSFNFVTPTSTTPGTTSGNTSTFSFGITPSTSSTMPTTTPGSFSFKGPSTTPQSSPFNTTGSTGTSVFGKTAESSNTTTQSSSVPTAPAFSFSMSGSQQK